MRQDVVRAPRIVVTLADLADHPEPERATRRAALYLDAVRRHGGDPVPIDVKTPPEALADVLAGMDGLLLTGGGDIDPARYSRPNEGSRDIDQARDALEARAWEAASERGVPVLGICRGLQAINVFAGGSLLQDVDGHEGPSWGTGQPATHPIEVVPGTRLGELVGSGAEPVVVNAYHHQGVRAEDLAPSLVASAWAASSAGPLVEGLEAPTGRFVVGIQCHPERTESTPSAFENVFEAFVRSAS
ncbi:MAG TPA: gamma-glutamyl-gamma-aminobutyrate hydrolase family protein [Patescibacteria group bacterium]|nr:gamma-glutamyl-gamma-aminobutyrate hydrolase family protein [Patescibacteria group bacterium]